MSQTRTENGTSLTEAYWRGKIAQEIRRYRIDTLPLIGDVVSPYVTGLIRAEIIARGLQTPTLEA